MPISLVRLSSSPPFTGNVPIVLGVTALRVMSHQAHDVYLMPGLVDGIFHGLAIDRQRIQPTTLTLWFRQLFSEGQHHPERNGTRIAERAIAQ